MAAANTALIWSTACIALSNKPIDVFPALLTSERALVIVDLIPGMVALTPINNTRAAAIAMDRVMYLVHTAIALSHFALA